jgi:hypothetical protein
MTFNCWLQGTGMPVPYERLPPPNLYQSSPPDSVTHMIFPRHFVPRNDLNGDLAARPQVLKRQEQSGTRLSPACQRSVFNDINPFAVDADYCNTIFSVYNNRCLDTGLTSLFLKY